MQPLMQLLRWESAIITRLEFELQIEREAASQLLDTHPALIRKAWHSQRSAQDTADQLIALSTKEKTK
ncbi:MAG: hypothetical protein Q8J78_09225 [Moraxellaceae bacterium]|nr:hypothetical protein [Moraxellaceae bacterium]